MDDFIENLKYYFWTAIDTVNKFVFGTLLGGFIKWLKKFKKEELLIGALLIGVFIAAFLPVVKLVIRSISPKNGVFMCYYNSKGVLMQQNSADKNYKKAKPAKNGVCVFKMPANSKKIQVTIIGGGGGGSASQIAKNQRNIEFDPVSREYDMLADDIELINPFDKKYVPDEIFTEKVLSKISLTVAGGGGGSVATSKETSGMGGICAIKQGMLKVGDKIHRISGENGVDGRNGTDGKMIYTSNMNENINLTAQGGHGIYSIGSGVKKDGDCSDEKYSAGHFRNESTSGSKAIPTRNQAFYSNFSMSKIVGEYQVEKIKAIKGTAGGIGEIFVFDVNSKDVKTIKICEQNSKEKCLAYVGKAGVGGTITNKDLLVYDIDISGQNGGDTKFKDKVARGGKGGNGKPDNVMYIKKDELIVNGDDGSDVQKTKVSNSGGNCKQGDCNAKNATGFGASGGGGGLLYQTQHPFQSTLVAKILDEQGNQLGKSVQFMETQEVDYSSDSRDMGNGGNGGSGAVIIRW